MYGLLKMAPMLLPTRWPASSKASPSDAMAPGINTGGIGPGGMLSQSTGQSQKPPQPSGAHAVPSHCFSQYSHWPESLQMSSPVHVPHEPLQPSSPQFFSSH